MRLGKYRTAESDFQKYISNQEIYDLDNAQRIDIHILQLIRDHYANSLKSDNNLIAGPCFENPTYLNQTLKTGYIPPETFLYLDKQGLTQDSKNVPIIFHVKRHATNKSITYERNLNTEKIYLYGDSTKPSQRETRRTTTGKTVLNTGGWRMIIIIKNLEINNLNKRSVIGGW